MAELDPGVMAAVREHMPSVCEGALDTLEGPHHRIVVGDALKYLEQQAQLVRRGHTDFQNVFFLHQIFSLKMFTQKFCKGPGI